MKSLFKFLITGLLLCKAKRHLKKNRTQVIAVTGSVGKTSTKEAIFAVLKDHFNVYRSQKGFNTELGIALAILQQEESGFSSAKAWTQILKNVFLKPLKSYQKIVLEMGADRPGDIKKLIKIAPPKIAVITHVAGVHLEEGQFRDLSAIAKEKGTLIKALEPDEVAVLNYDDALIQQMPTRGRKLTYGVQYPAMVQASDIHATAKGLKFTVKYKNNTQDFSVPVLGDFQVYVALPAIAVGLEMGMSLGECAKALESFKLPPGRMNSISGVNKSQLIDSSYNASPMSVLSALNLLKSLKADRKIAALGTMNELGADTKEAHHAVGKLAAEVANVLIAVGPEAGTLKQGALDAGMAESSIYTFFDSEEAGHALKAMLQPRDLVLVKGSQNRVRMERLVKVIMEKPEEAGELLCRQGEAWSKI